MIIRVLLFLVFPIIIIAQDASEVIQKLQHKFSTIQDITAQFSQSVNSGKNLQTMNLEGEFYFKKENSFSIKMVGRAIISDGISVWNIDENQNKVVISLVDEESSSFSLTEIIYSYPNKCELTLIDKNKGFVVKAVPKESMLSFKEAYLTIDTNFILNTVEIIDFNDIKYLFQLSNIKLNQKLDDALFKFNPSDKVEVIDLR